MNEKISVIGVGYVGLPVALAFAKKYETIAFDVNKKRIESLKQGHDLNSEEVDSELASTSLRFTDNAEDLKSSTFFVVAVPTPITSDHKPDLGPLLSTCETIGKIMQPGCVVVFESTVYPGLTEDLCGPALEKASGLKQGKDFKLGYSPERINPGDRENTIEKIIKIVSGEDQETLDRVAEAYGKIIDAGIHRAETIKVAEAAKVIENSQRDLNIAFMNELAIICEKLDIRTIDVLNAAGSKWNFMPFRPGLVGGHCIGVDPYYLTAKAEEIGYYPQVILAGRRINDGMGAYVAQRVIKLLVREDMPVRRARVGIMGLTFKENVSDIRNSKVMDIIDELKQFGITPLVHDPLADAEEVKREYGIELSDTKDFEDLNALIIAVPHKEFEKYTEKDYSDCLVSQGVLVDVKSLLDPAKLKEDCVYWSL